ncbi:MAG: polysaccharide deacetylase family protein [Paludibaculum sp.]
MRGRSAQLFGPSVSERTRQPAGITLPSTTDQRIHPRPPQPAVRARARATYFQCGHHVRRLPRVAQRYVDDGHEIGNHTDSHPALYLRSSQFIYDQLEDGRRRRS